MKHQHLYSPGIGRVTFKGSVWVNDSGTWYGEFNDRFGLHFNLALSSLILL